MTVLPIVVSPDPRLTEVSEPVEDITQDIQTLMDDMLDTMYAANGLGLSAVQVGVMKRVVVVDLRTNDEEKNPIKMINPEIIDASDDTNIYNEGCLSFPGQYSDVERPKQVTIKYLDENGKEQIIAADDLLATCVQHEIDHMNGTVFVDHISRLKRDTILKKVAKARKQGALDETKYLV